MVSEDCFFTVEVVVVVLVGVGDWTIFIFVKKYLLINICNLILMVNVTKLCEF